MSRPVGAAGLALIKDYEGCRLTAYKPVPNETYWTIGWGHYGPDVKPGQTITLEEAEATLSAWVEKASAIWSVRGLEAPVSLRDLAASPAGVQQLLHLVSQGEPVLTGGDTQTFQVRVP